MFLCVRLPDVWVNEGDRLQLKTKVVHLSKLPTDTAVLLDPSIYRCVCVSVKVLFDDGKSTRLNFLFSYRMFF